jgi:phage recombination protein Bet
MAEQALQAVQAPSLLAKIAARYSVDPAKLMSTLKATAFKVREGEVTNEQMMALLIVADQYHLNPITRELFAFPDKGGIVPVVSIDGWARIINDNPALDGIEFNDGPENEQGIPEWIECVIYRKDRSHPTRLRERFREVRRDTQPWKSHPARMMRHKVLIQCARVAFGFSGIYDQDEAERIVDVSQTAQVVERKPLTVQVRRKSEVEKAPNEDVNRTLEAAPVLLSLESLLVELQQAESDERIDYLCSVAKENLTNGGLKAFQNAATNRAKELNGEAS